MSSVQDILEFKNEIGVVVVSVIKKKDGEMVFVQTDNNFLLTEREQAVLVNFISGNL
jgi:hypothetical protein